MPHFSGIGSGVRIGLGLIVALALVLPASAQTALQLQTDTTPLKVDPGSVATRPVRLTNTGSETVAVRLQLDLPQGWSVLIPPAEVTLAEGQTTSQLISFRIPVGTTAGRYVVSVTSHGTSEAGVTMDVEVNPRVSVGAEWMGSVPMIRAGARISASLRVINRGNAPAQWSIQARSSLRFPVELEPSRVELDPGESAEVTVSVSTRDDVSTRLTHALLVQVGEASEGQLTLNTDVVPAVARTGLRREGWIPATLTLLGTSEEGSRAGQIELRIPETDVKGNVVEVLLRMPDARRVSTFSQPDRYSIRVAAPGWEVRAGDHIWEAGDLLEVGTLGFGVGGRYATERWTSGGFIQRSRQVFPEREQAHAFVTARLRDNLSVTLNGLAKRSFEQGESASMAVDYFPGGQQMSAEVATGSFRGESGRAARAEMVLEHRRATLSMRAEAADRHFLGAIQGITGGSLNSLVRLGEAFRWTAQWRSRKRSYDNTVSGTAHQTWTTARSGIMWQHAASTWRTSITVSALGQVNDNTLTALRREERALETRITWNRRRMGANITARRGQADDPIRARLDPYLSTQGSVYASRRALSLSLSASWLDGPTFYNPFDQERVSIGVNAGWDKGGRTRVNGGFFRSTDRLVGDQQFTMADFRLIHEFAFGHELTLRTRTMQTTSNASVRDASFSAAWTVPLQVPVPGVSASRRLSGQVRDLETGTPVSGAVLRLDDRSATTDEGGRFDLPMGGAAVAYLTVDRASIGFDRRPVGTFPMAVDASTLPGQDMVIEVVRAAGIDVVVQVETSTGDRDAALNTALDESDRAGVLVEVRSGNERLRRLTDREGRARFADLVPGTWRVFALGNSIPAGARVRPDTLTLSVSPGETVQASLTIAPARRSIQVVGSGGVSIGGGVRRLQPDSGQESARAAEPVPAEVVAADTAADLTGAIHLVREGDWLTRLARFYYDGSAQHWVRIWLANRSEIQDPDLLIPGTHLRIPPAGPLTESERGFLREWMNAR